MLPAGSMIWESWIGRTKQTWKILVFAVLLCVDLPVVVVFVWKVNDEELLNGILPSATTLALVATALIAASFAWYVSSIRCPICRRSVSWHVLKNADQSMWFRALVELEACPMCHRGAR